MQNIHYNLARGVFNMIKEFENFDIIYPVVLGGCGGGRLQGNFRSGCPRTGSHYESGNGAARAGNGAASGNQTARYR